MEDVVALVLYVPSHLFAFSSALPTTSIITNNHNLLKRNCAPQLKNPCRNNQSLL